MAFYFFLHQIWTEILFSVERAETFDELILAFPELLPVLKKAKGVDSKWNVAKVRYTIVEYRITTNFEIIINNYNNNFFLYFFQKDYSKSHGNIVKKRSLQHASSMQALAQRNR